MSRNRYPGGWFAYAVLMVMTLALSLATPTSVFAHPQTQRTHAQLRPGPTPGQQPPPPPPKGNKSQEPPPEPRKPFLELGTSQGIGGEDFMRFDRGRIKDQILQFIPPLLQPAFVGHAFVLPPRTFRVGLSSRFATVHGDDFFAGGDPNTATFGDFRVQRRFVDLDLFYGFDLNRHHLHGFTARLNVPLLISTAQGQIHPNGVPFIGLLANAGSTQIGDISLFVKKRVLDQGNAPVGVAIMGAVQFPTGSNEQRFGDNGYILARRPDPDGDGVQPSFDAMIHMLGGPQNFFNGAWRVPAAMLAAAPQVLTPFPFNGGVFGRFSSDGRLPSVLQPGTGAFGWKAGLFITRQFEPGDFRGLGRFPGRSALHAGVLYEFRGAADGIDPGNLTTFFAAFVKPLYRDYVALDLTFVGFHQQLDRYAGMIPEPEIVRDPDTGVEMFEFARVRRPSFTGGTTMMLAPSVIVSPDPQLRFTASGLFRVRNPELGPAPQFVFRLGSSVTF